MADKLSGELSDQLLDDCSVRAIGRLGDGFADAFRAILTVAQTVAEQLA